MKPQEHQAWGVFRRYAESGGTNMQSEDDWMPVWENFLYGYEIGCIACGHLNLIQRGDPIRQHNGTYSRLQVMQSAAGYYIGRYFREDGANYDEPGQSNRGRNYAKPIGEIGIG